MEARIRLSIPFRMLPKPGLPQAHLQVRFQFLLGCYMISNNLEEVKGESFQFLLGCYLPFPHVFIEWRTPFNSFQDATLCKTLRRLHKSNLSIPFRMLLQNIWCLMGTENSAFNSFQDATKAKTPHKPEKQKHTFNSFQDATSRRDGKGNMEGNELSIPFRMLLLREVSKCIAISVFQFLLGCYLLFVSGVGCVTQCFQFLLGCYFFQSLPYTPYDLSPFNSFQDATTGRSMIWRNYVHTLSIPFRMLPSAPNPQHTPVNKLSIPFRMLLLGLSVMHMRKRWSFNSFQDATRARASRSTFNFSLSIPFRMLL